MGKSNTGIPERELLCLKCELAVCNEKSDKCGWRKAMDEAPALPQHSPAAKAKGAKKRSNTCRQKRQAKAQERPQVERVARKAPKPVITRRRPTRQRVKRPSGRPVKITRHIDATADKRWLQQIVSDVRAAA